MTLARDWNEVAGQVLAGHTCLWQDLDGLHVEGPPSDPPPTSILWAWSPDGAMVRVRLDGSDCFVATCRADARTEPVEPWATADGRVHGARFADPSGPGLHLRLEQHVDDGIATGTGPITFLRARGSA